jgi:hypothetical protein
LCNKALAFVVIVLFLGVGFYPALSIEIPINENPDIDEDYFEFQSNVDNRLAKNFFKYIENSEDRPICEFLLKYARYFDDLRHYYFNLSLYNPDNLMYNLVFIVYSTITINIFIIGAMLNCWDDPFDPSYTPLMRPTFL